MLCYYIVNYLFSSLVANLAAANHYTVDHMATTEVQDVFGSAKVFYMTGFFLTVSPEAAMTFAKASKAKGGVCDIVIMHVDL